MRKFIPSILLFIVISSAFTLVNSSVTRSAITFKIKNMGIGTGGTVSGLQADVKFNPANPASGSLAASVDANTINTDNNSRDEHLKKEEYFDVAHYPRITLKSISFKHTAGDNYTGQFNLTIKNKTKQIEIPFTYTEKSGVIAFKGEFKINRQDFGVGGSSLILGNEVTVNIVAEATK